MPSFLGHKLDKRCGWCGRGWVLVIEEDFEQARVLLCLLMTIGFLSLQFSIKPFRRCAGLKRELDTPPEPLPRLPPTCPGAPCPRDPACPVVHAFSWNHN
eukprot:2353248-Prymnesium_polylepis.2